MKKYETMRDRVRRKALAIESGEIKDDYTNHFLSHFGFHENDNTKEEMVNLEIHKDNFKK